MSAKISEELLLSCEGMTATEAAKKIGVSVSGITSAAKRLGIKFYKRPVPDLNEEKLRSMAGMTTAEIAEMTGAKRHSVARAIKVFGIGHLFKKAPDKRERLTKDFLLTMVGKKPKEISKITGMREKYIYLAVKRHGLSKTFGIQHRELRRDSFEAEEVYTLFTTTKLNCYCCGAEITINLNDEAGKNGERMPKFICQTCKDDDNCLIVHGVSRTNTMATRSDTFDHGRVLAGEAFEKAKREIMEG